MTQAVWGDDICPVRRDREKKKSESWPSESSATKYYLTAEQRGMGGEPYGPSQR